MTTVPDTVRAPARRLRVLRRPQSTTGFWSWFTTIDHKKIGIMYGTTALAFFVIGGVERLLLRLQLAGPNGTLLTAAQYNELFTMHGTTMVFLMGMPLAVAFGNYLIPLQIGARDVAFPRLNAFGYWGFLMGGLFIYSSFFIGGIAPNLFWLFGHPEVYILILPGMGIVSEILPVFSRKPLFGYPVVVFSGIAIGFIGWGVWAHHMFATGLGPVAISAFALSTMIIAVPTGVKIFIWLATVWRGAVRLKTAMLCGLGIIAMVTLGGLSCVLHSVVPADTQQTDTYFVVAHFHYVLFGGLVFGLFGGFYYWFPKLYGRFLDERLGKFNFWTMLIGFNLTFFPMHFVGLLGMPRRTYRYDTGLGWDFLNQLETIGAFVIAVSVLAFIVNVMVSRRHGQVSGDDPWDARTLEWTTPSPPPMYNFAETPPVA